MKLPPEEIDDVTPPESSIKTILVSDDVPTVELGSRVTSLVGSGRLDVHSLVRARAGARDAAFSECRRNCDAYQLSYRQGALVGAFATALGIVGGLAAYAILRA